jgi:Zn-dependent M28 family amino/carboxypeptidase
MKLMFLSLTATRRVNAFARSGLTPALLVLLSFLSNACTGNAPTNNAPTNAASSNAATPPAAATPARPTFDGQRAFEHVRKMVEIGPRPAGSAELARTREYITGELEAAGLKVSSDKFTAQTPVGAREMVNLTAELAGESPDIIIISSHYDTKPFKEVRFVGANDGGSSTGALIEIARSLAASARKSRFTYRFVFFDGEEAFCKTWSQCGTESAPDNTYGSRRYVAQLNTLGELKRVRAMILLDMIGYTDLAIPRESLSTPWLVDIIWETADELGYGAQFTDTEESVEDDHIPFLQAEIPVVDLIQLSGYMRYWHTPEDTLDKISPRSLQIVGETVIASLPRIEQRLAGR